MPYNSETETFYQAPATVVDSTPDGDTVQEGFDDRLTPAMAGLYADLNLLKADGMISVGIPATTTARGIGRVATAADAAVGSTITNGPAFLDAATWKISATSAGGTIPLADANGKLDAWVNPQTQYATCATAAATAGKEATLTGFSLVKGARVFVTFSNANTVTGPLTLNVNGTGAREIYNELGVVSSSNPMRISAGIATEFIYDGTHWTYQAAGGAYDYIGSAFRNLQAGSSINGSVVGSGVGSFVALYANNSGAFTLPAGGTWFVFCFGTNGTGSVEWANSRVYVIAGGSTVPITSWAQNGFAIRIK